jgi:hypothetical protein
VIVECFLSPDAKREDKGAEISSWCVHHELNTSLWMRLPAQCRSRKMGTHSKPVALNTKPDGSDDPDGRQKNRRVEITIKKH